MKDDEHKHRSKHWLGCPVEAEYFGEERKSGKAQRKLASARDRSKYKKTDKEKTAKEPQTIKKENLLPGRVLSITPQGILVGHEGMQYVCSLRGLLKKEKSQFKNLVTVGDFVLFEKNTPDEGLIFSIEPRKTVLSRADNLSRRKEQLIASNIDQVLITMSVVEPALKPFLADRYIIAAQKGGMDPIIVINKIDLLNESSDSAIKAEKELYLNFIQAYKTANIPVISVSADTGEGMNHLREVMQGKASVFSGQSGVGKSSLINAVAGLELRIGHIVERTGKGTHTTTTANLLPLPFGGWCVDTPGIKSFGIWDLKNNEVVEYFFEIHTYGKKCKYPNCTHLHEADCAVIAAVESGDIALMRYESYQFLMESIRQEHKRR